VHIGFWYSLVLHLLSGKCFCWWNLDIGVVTRRRGDLNSSFCEFQIHLYFKSLLSHLITSPLAFAPTRICPTSEFVNVLISFLNDLFVHFLLTFFLNFSSYLLETGSF